MLSTIEEISATPEEPPSNAECRQNALVSPDVAVATIARLRSQVGRDSRFDDPQFADGYALGERWASQIATAWQLRQIADDGGLDGYSVMVSVNGSCLGGGSHETAQRIKAEAVLRFWMKISGLPADEIGPLVGIQRGLLMSQRCEYVAGFVEAVSSLWNCVNPWIA
jgi:hypothetical protein